MSKFIIRFGEFKKALLLPFLLALTQIIIFVLDIVIYERVKSHLLESTAIGLGEFAVIIIPYLKCFSISNKNERTKCSCSKKICLNYIILLILYAIQTNAIYFSYLFNINKYNNVISSSIFRSKIEKISTQQGLEIIIITIMSIFMLKYKYFIHHYISVFLFCLSSVANDLILDNYKKLFLFIKPSEILLYVGSFLAEGVYFCFIKYMIDKHYHHYWNIMFSVGLMVLIINTILLITYLINGNKKGQMIFIDLFWEYLRLVPTTTIALKFIINIILQFISSILEILTIFYLTPEYILISQNLSKIGLIINMLIVREKYITKKYQYCFLIFYVFQVFSLMIYLEIVELNFCNLNKNTRKNIKSRVDDDLIERIDSFNGNGFESNGGYIFNNTNNNINNKDKDKDNIKIEMNNKHLEGEHNDN